MFRRIGKVLLWTVVAVIGLIVAAVVLLYIPPVQDYVKELALCKVRESTGMDIRVGMLRLRFPLTVQLSDVTVVEAAGDTMVCAGSVGLDVRFWPLLRGDVDVDGAKAQDLFYQLGTPDSAMWLRARVDGFDLDAASLSLGSGDINVGKASADGVDVRLVMKDTVTATTDEAAASSPMLIKVGEIELKNVSYMMTMMPVIDSLSVSVPSARLAGGTVDMGRNAIDVQTLEIDSVSALYLTPAAEYLAAHPAPEPADTVASTSSPWTVTAGRVALTAREATYAMRGAQPQPGLDMNYLQVSDVSIEVDSLFNRATAIRVPLSRLSATERCGVRLLASGLFEMDSVMMRAQHFNVTTGFSTLSLNAEMGVQTPPAASSPLSVDALADIAQADIVMAFPALSSFVRQLPPASSLKLKADASGTSSSVDVRSVSVSVGGLMALDASGTIDNPMDPAKISGQLDIDGSMTGLNRLKPTLLEAKVAHEVNIPPMSVGGRINYSPGLVRGNLAVRTGEGHMTLGAGWQERSEGYQLDLSLDRFPVASFLPTAGVGDITLTADVKGHGYDPFSASTEAAGRFDIVSATYLGREYKDVVLEASLADRHATASLVSNNPDALLSVDMDATMTDAGYVWTLDGDVSDLDLTAMRITPTANSGSLSIAGSGQVSRDMRDIDANLRLSSVDWNLEGTRIAFDSLTLTLGASDSLTHAVLASGDLHADAVAFCSIDTLLGRISALPAVIDTAVARRNADIRRLQAALPEMDLTVNAGADNFLAEYLRAGGTGFSRANLTFHNDSLMAMNAEVLRIRAGQTKLDTVTFGAVQHGKYLAFKGALNNRPGTFDQFAHVNLTGFLADDKLALLLRQRDIEGRQGFFLGLNLTVDDSLATLRFVPRKPTVGYKEWSLNTDNFVTYNFATRHIDANLTMQSDRSLIRLFTEHGADTAAHHAQEDLVVQLSDIHLADWLSISPFAPPVKGDLGADMRFHWNAEQLTGRGNVTLTDLFYGRERVGSFDVGVDVTTSRSGVLQADASLLVDSVKVITATGVLNDTTSANPFLLDFSMIRFPLSVVNPFLPKDVARLRGMLNGQLDITGSMTQPVFNGFLDFDSTAVKVGMLGTEFTFSEGKIPVDSSVVRFDKFSIKGVNDNPLMVDGTVDLRSLSDMRIDLSLNASDMQIVNSSRARGADVYGKAFIDASATVKGNMSLLDVDASLSVLPGTNVTYVLSGAESVIASKSTGDMVKFVQFSDTSAVAEADTIQPSAMAMVLNAELNVLQGSTINVDISSDGKNRATVQGQGTLDFSMNPMNDGRLTGRFTINSGFVRYTPPMMSEKKFDFEEGSYVAFNGDMLNPILNVKAVDRMKANVTQTGQNSRLIDFDVSVAVTNTLENMNVAFDLSTSDDITVQNELASMSPEQRANQAMNLLLYNTYTGPGTRASSSLSGNPLYSFLASQLNSWAANTIKGVDISFGIDQYDKTTDGYTSSTTSYSYRVSKSLFNDRFKIIVGGNYSTDADADENFQQNLINDIAFEYMLNRSGSMYVRIFRHTGYESILEGEITQTGVGFVLRRKINSLRDLFRWAGRLKNSIIKPKEAEVTETETQTTETHTTDETTR